MNDATNILILLVAAAAVYFVIKSEGELGPDGLPLGKKPPKRDGGGSLSADQIEGSIGAAACLAGAAYAGAPQVGASVAPLCAWLAPKLVDGTVYVAKKIGEGGRDVAGGIASGAATVASGAAGVASSIGSGASGAAHGIIQAGSAYVHTITAVPEKVVSVGTHGIVTGVKAGTSAVKGLANKVLGFL